MSEAYFLFIFATNQEVVKVEKELKGKKLKVEAVPLPKSIGAYTEFGLKVPVQNMEEIKKLYKVQKTRIYFIEVEDDNMKIIKKW